MIFSELVQAIATGSLAVTGIYHDSRRVQPGSVFVAIPGNQIDGHEYIHQAIVAGAAYVVGERAISLSNYVQVTDSRAALADLAYAYYGQSRQLAQIGITGTNGKSTTCHLLASLLNAGQVPTATIGTLGVFFPENRWREKTLNTTPDALEMARLLAQLQQQGARVAAVEISSIALEQQRHRGMNFTGVIFTNLTQDHLDYHKDFESYFQAKRRLFLEPHGQAVINIDDPYGVRLVQEFPDSITVSLQPGVAARIGAQQVTTTEGGLRFLLQIDDRAQQVQIPLFGRYNLYNFLSALGGIMCLGLDPFAFLGGVGRLTLPKGRWEVVGRDPTVIVDYAHTPDGMEQVLSQARHMAKGKVITVFGCTGNRDREKRPIMGEIASRYSEYVVLSNDNPEGEDPESIAQETLRGIYKPHMVELDREKAIQAAITMAEPEDIVLVLGKGHEETMDFGDKTIPFSDTAVAKRYWKEQRRRQGKLGEA